ncbi:hypothetical protein [Montanilutibacter psychrotolerans]|uniref:Uncharacterized protein n=1 Tax=Montanilutibacter psychrotolerans TaxID=1327343 RepID=A0A3M8SLR4_9GAMM|nr:hypothetical protein [Lysobacter psychrotolerans]RNF82251.1 hypothetical protein EER27_15165 [Lysobacter psychrotolerans]
MRSQHDHPETKTPTQATGHRAAGIAALAVATLLLAGCGKDEGVEGALDQAAGAIGKTLPTPYRDGLVVDAAKVEGNDLVFVIRNPDITVAKARGKKDVLDALQRDEQDAISELCRHDDLAAVLKNGGGVRRRFVDGSGQSFFEVTLQPAQCNPAGKPR